MIPVCIHFFLLFTVEMCYSRYELRQHLGWGRHWLSVVLQFHVQPLPLIFTLIILFPTSVSCESGTMHCRKNKEQAVDKTSALLTKNVILVELPQSVYDPFVGPASVEKPKALSGVPFFLKLPLTELGK